MNSRRVIVVVMFLLVVVLAGVAIFLGIQLSNQSNISPSDTFAANCPGGTVPSCTQSCIEGCAGSDFPTECRNGCPAACQNNCSGGCGNGACDNGETSGSCPQDCGAPPPVNPPQT